MAGYRIDHFGNAVARSFVNNFFQKQGGEGRANAGKKNGPPKMSVFMQPGQHGVQAYIQEQCRQSAADADNNGKND